MKTITMYELLGMIKDGKAPKKIKYNDYIYIVGRNTRKHFVDYCSEEDERCFNYYVSYENLNDTVEILEEEKKIPEKLRLSRHIGGTFESEQVYRNKRDDEITEKINSIIDCLKSKGDE